MYSRFRSAVGRVLWMKGLCGGVWPAMRMLWALRSNPNKVHKVQYRGIELAFRGPDEQAIKEVLVDREYQFLGDLLAVEQKPIILDIGAHIGTFAIWVLSTNPDAEILSVEASPDNFRIADQNSSVLRKSGAKWRVVNKAASGKSGEDVSVSEHGPSMSYKVTPGAGMSVSTVSVSDLVDLVAQEGGRVTLAKIDIEGSEENVVCVDRDGLKRIDQLVIELHPGMCDTERVRAALHREFRYIYEVPGRVSSKPLLHCTR